MPADMMRHLFLLLLVCSFLNARPQGNPRCIEWKLLREFSLPLPNNDNIPLSLHTAGTPNELNLLFYNETSRQLLRYRWPKGLLADSIPIRLKPEQDIWTLRYVSPDKIFVLFNAAKNVNYNHSGTLIKMNNRGELLQSYPVRNLPVACTECRPVAKDSLMYITGKYNELNYAQHRLYFTLESYYHYPGDSLFNSSRYPLFGFVDTRNDSSGTVPVFLPAIATGTRYDKRARVPSLTCDRQGNPVYALRFGHTLYRYNTRTGTQHSYPLTSFWPDSIHPVDATLFRTPPQDDYTQLSPRNLYYHPYDHYYIRFSSLPLPAQASPADRRNPDYLVSVIDTNFRIIAEGILPKHLTTLCYFAPGCIGFWNKDRYPLHSTDSICFSEYKIIPVRGSKATLVAQLRQRDTTQAPLGMEAYLRQNFTLPKRKAVVYFIPLSACKSCISETVRQLQAADSTKAPYLLVAANSRDEINSFLEPFKITSSTHLWTDAVARYAHYLPPPVLQGSAVLMINGNVVKELPLLPGNLVQVMHAADTFLSSP